LVTNLGGWRLVLLAVMWLISPVVARKSGRLQGLRLP
jgi:hypothetical protein